MKSTYSGNIYLAVCIEPTKKFTCLDPWFDITKKILYINNKSVSFDIVLDAIFNYAFYKDGTKKEYKEGSIIGNYIVHRGRWIRNLKKHQVKPPSFKIEAATHFIDDFLFTFDGKDVKNIFGEIVDAPIVICHNDPNIYVYSNRYYFKVIGKINQPIEMLLGNELWVYRRKFSGWEQEKFQELVPENVMVVDGQVVEALHIEIGLQ